jgi:ribosomal-protein-serine acetyltransferase
VYLSKWLPFVCFTLKIADTNSFIESAIECEDFFLIYFEDIFVGVIGLKGIDVVNGKLELGYWLKEDAQGNGIISQTINYLEGLIFEEYKLNRIEIKCAEGNLKSIKIAESLGYVLEGVERESEFDGESEFRDLRVYSKLYSDLE